MASSTITNTGVSTASGSVAVSPGSSLTGFPPGIVTGEIHTADPTAQSVQAAVGVAYQSALAQTCNFNFSIVTQIGGFTYRPGTYCYSVSAAITGMITLDGVGDANALFVFITGTTLTTAARASTRLINGARACGVLWIVGSSATFGTSTALQGNVLASASIAVQTGSTITGALMSQNAGVSLDNSLVSVTGSCGVSSNIAPTAPVSSTACGHRTATGIIFILIGLLLY